MIQLPTTAPDVELDEDNLPSALPNLEKHDELLDYLKERLEQGNQPREERITRYAKIDKMISTWQELTATDAQRAAKQEATGQAQALKMNLPLVQTHTDDMVSYFAGIYAPTNGEFFYAVDPTLLQQFKELTKKMKEDAKASKYYKEAAKALRGLVKYNIGGLMTRWVYDTLDEEALGPVAAERNLFKSIDMYNFLYDPSIEEVSEIPRFAEWAAVAEVKNTLWFLRRELKGLIDGAGAVIGRDSGKNTKGTATYYKFPPSHVGVTHEDSRAGDQSSKKLTWDSYFPSLRADSLSSISGHELVTMYCWLNPNQFDLVHNGSTTAPELQLWRFLIMDNCRIIQATPVDRTQYIPGQDDDNIEVIEIPYYLTRLNIDELGEEMRSIAELLKGFQNFGSFLLNSHIDSVRSEIFGVTAYDPEMFDMGQLAEGSTAARIPSKSPGRDVRSGLMRLQTDGSSRQPLNDLTTLMSIMREFFPTQALPSQIAGIDRAVTGQVAAVMQGATRRLALYMRIMDSDLFGPVRMASYRNIADNQALDLSGVDEGAVERLLGSGVTAANNEAASQMFQQLLFAIIQNQEAAQNYDVPSIMNVWANMMNIDVDLSSLVRQQEPQEGEQPPQNPEAMNG